MNTLFAFFMSFFLHASCLFAVTAFSSPPKVDESQKTDVRVNFVSSKKKIKSKKKNPKKSKIASIVAVKEEERAEESEEIKEEEWAPVDAKNLRSAPQVLRAHKVEMEYPPIAKKLSIQGNVVLLVEISKTGEVRHVQILESMGFGADEIAVDAMRRFRFEPAVDHAGLAVDTIVKHVIKFRL